MSPLSEYHDKIQNHVITELKDLGFEVIEFVYHKFKDKLSIEQLKKCTTPECMFIRILPDILVLKDRKSMFIEIKSKSPRYENLALELFPLMVNYYLEIMGLNVMYLYGYEDRNREIKLYYLPTKEVIKLVDRVIITDKFDERINSILRNFSSNILRIEPEIYTAEKIVKRKTSSENIGSGDPFVLIKKDNLSKFKEFKNVIQEG